MIFVVLIGIFVALVFFFGYRYKILADRLPPGPLPVVFFGNLLQIEKDSRITFLKWNKIIKPIYTVWIKMTVYVFITYNSLISDTFIKHTDEFFNDLQTGFSNTSMDGK